MLDEGYEQRLRDMDIDDVNKENTSKSLVSTGESTYNIEKSAKNSEGILEDIRDGLVDKKVDRRRTVISKQIAGVRFRVVEYQSSYVGGLSLATNMYHAQRLGMKLRSLEVDLNNGKVQMESDMFQSSEGNVKLKQKMNPIHMAKGVIRKMNKESFFRPEFIGTGTVRLESDFKFVHLMDIQEDTRLVLEKGIYLASAGEWDYTTAKNFNVGMVFFSEKSVLQTELRGKGLVALELPVHRTELIKHKVTENRPFKVSGEHVLFWQGDLKRQIHPAKKLLGNLASGRGIVEEYTGEGYVYTAPTIGFYNKLVDNLKGKNTGNTDPINDDADLGKQDRSLKDKIGMRSNSGKVIAVLVSIIVIYVLFKIIF